MVRAVASLGALFIHFLAAQVVRGHRRPLFEPRSFRRHRNGQTTIDHSGDDWDVHSFVIYLPSQQRGMVVFTNGEKGVSVICEAVAVAYHDPLFLATL